MSIAPGKHRFRIATNVLDELGTHVLFFRVTVTEKQIYGALIPGLKAVRIFIKTESAYGCSSSPASRCRRSCRRAEL